MQREAMPYDVVIVGAGPSGLSAAIQLKQLCLEKEQDLSICIVEKAAEVGGHILSGAVIETRALDELIPDWQQLDAPIKTAVTQDQFWYLTANKAWQLPTPGPMHNQGNYIISLADFCRWLSDYAQQLGVEIYPGFAATEVLYDEDDRVYGIATGDMGLDKQNQPTERYQAGIEIHAKQVMLAEGCRGSLTKQLEQHYGLRKQCDPQTYGTGIKELWQVDKSVHQPGLVIHSVGWPLDKKTYGGSFIYHWDEDLVSVGFVVGLDYENPYLDPFQELQRFKHHPKIKSLFEHGKRIGYGARALSEGGFQSIPQLSFPGGVLIGDCAGFLNVPKIKGTHTAMKSGIEAAKAVYAALQSEQPAKLVDYKESLKKTWLWRELKQVRNIRPAFQKGLWFGLSYAALDSYLLRGRAPWTLHHHQDHEQLKPATNYQPIDYPKADSAISFDKLSSVFLSNTNHEENQPCHLQLKQPQVAIELNYQQYASPESRYCPANVYEIVKNEKGEASLQINAANCVHCKTCDIKDPSQNINWVPPEGGGGPNYPNM